MSGHFHAQIQRQSGRVTARFIPPAKTSQPSFQIADLPTTTKRRRSKRAAVPARCDTQIRPDCLQALYNIPTTAATASGNSLGVAGFIDEIANADDLTVRATFIM